MLERSLRNQKRAVEIGVDNGSPSLWFDEGGRRSELTACVIDEEIQRAVLVDDALDDAINRIFFSYVELYRRCISACAFNLLHDLG